MAFTRFHDDPCRKIKQLQQSTGPGRYMLDEPGNGSTPPFMDDPYIIPQKWGGNLWTNTINVESALIGVNGHLSRDCLGKDEFSARNVQTKPVQYPLSKALTTEQSRAIMPAWTARDKEQTDYYYLPLNPQENTCYPFQNNLSTRILEKDYFVRDYTCLPPSHSNNLLPVQMQSNYFKSSVCSNNDSCERV
jgi:hypothetical protein